MTDKELIPTRALRMMKSNAARESRHSVKEILATKERKEIAERKHLLDKHYNLLKAKKQKQKKGIMDEAV